MTPPDGLVWEEQGLRGGVSSVGGVFWLCERGTAQSREDSNGQRKGRSIFQHLHKLLTSREKKKAKDDGGRMTKTRILSKNTGDGHQITKKSSWGCIILHACDLLVAWRHLSATFSYTQTEVVLSN